MSDTGIVTVCMGVTKSYAGLVTSRFFLGLFEAGFVPGRAIFSNVDSRTMLTWTRMYVFDFNVLLPS